MTPTRLLAALLAPLTLWCSACADQPTPYCPVTVGTPLGFPSPGSPLAFTDTQFGLPNFWAKYTLKTGTGACAQLAGEELGFQRFEAPGKELEITIAMRPFLPSFTRGNEASFNSLDWAFYDDEWLYDFADEEVDAAPLFRVDPADPDGAKLNSLGALAPDPADENACLASGLTAIDTTFQEEVVTLLPGGRAGPRATVVGDTATFPALHLVYEWDQVKVYNTTEIPGSIFTGTLRYTQDACTATYDVLGIWPITLCHTDLDCSPSPVENPAPGQLGIPAREFQGSGLNPAFQTEEHPLRCNNSPEVHAYTAQYGPPPLSLYPGGDRRILDFEYEPVYGIESWGVCEMTRPVSDFSAAP